MKEPVARLIGERFPATLELAGAGLLVAIVLAFPLGMIAGANPGGAADLGAMGFAILGISVPHIYLGPLMMIVFSLDLGWFPLTGRGGLAHLVLPAVTLGTALAAILARMLRQSLVAGARRRLHPHRAQQGTERDCRADAPWIAQRADAGHHAARAGGRRVADGRDRHRDDLLMARAGAAD